MGIGPGDHNHSEFAATGDKLAERITIAEPLAAMVERKVRRIIRDASTRAQADGIRPSALEVIEPEWQVEAAGVLFDEGELRPTKRARDPGRSDESIRQGLRRVGGKQ